jgi:RNA polymerase sigma-70 factor, ECF subfamily
MDDTSLVKAFQKGDIAAFDQLVLRHKDKVHGICNWFINDEQDANDVAQDVFIKVYKGVKRFRFESSFSTWLYRITVNTCKNKIRSLEYRIRKRFRRIKHANGSAGNNPSLDVAEESLSPLIQLEKKERTRLIRQAIDTLSQEKKSVIILRDIEGFSYEEIAEIAGITLGTVKSRLARARNDLRKKLGSML